MIRFRGGFPEMSWICWSDETFRESVLFKCGNDGWWRRKEGLHVAMAVSGFGGRGGMLRTGPGSRDPGMQHARSPEIRISQFESFQIPVSFLSSVGLLFTLWSGASDFIIVFGSKLRLSWTGVTPSDSD